jgi:hypothetical protein
MCSRPHISIERGTQPGWQPYSLVFPPVFLSLLLSIQRHCWIAPWFRSSDFSNGGINKQLTSTKCFPAAIHDALFGGKFLSMLISEAKRLGGFLMVHRVSFWGCSYFTGGCRLLQEVLILRDVLLIWHVHRLGPKQNMKPEGRFLPPGWAQAGV